MDHETAQARLLDTAEELFYGRGIQAVGMDDIRNVSGVSLKRLYQLFPAKEQLVEAYLDRRDARWRQSLAEYVQTRDDRQKRVLAVFDWLHAWFSEPGFRGCAWINSYGELGACSAFIAAHARRHKEGFTQYVHGLVGDAGLPSDLADHLILLAEGAIVKAGIFGTPEAALQAKTAAAVLLEAAKQSR